MFVGFFLCRCVSVENFFFLALSWVYYWVTSKESAT